MQKTKLNRIFLGLIATIHLCAPALANHDDSDDGGGIGGSIIDPGSVADSFSAAVDAIFPVIDFTEYLPPQVGFSYVDPIFGSVIKRVSDARGTSDSGRGTQALPLIAHEYSTVSAFNTDSSLMLLVHFSYFALYDGQGNFIRELPYKVTAASEPRWSQSDPSVFYYLDGNELRRFDVDTDKDVLVERFSEYAKISGKGEADISFDGRYRVLVGDNRDIFVYDLEERRKGPVLVTSPGSFDNVYMTPDNHVLVGWYEQGSERRNGIEMFDMNMNFIRQVAPVIAHMDVGRDTDGSEILVWHNSPWRFAPRTCQNGVMKIRLRDARKTCLMTFEWGIGVHISLPEDEHVAIISTYSASDFAEGESHVPRYKDEILRVKLDGSGLERLAHHWSRAYDNYAFQPKASASRDGSRIVYSSNYRQQDKHEDYPAIYTDAFLLCLECEDEVNRQTGWVRSDKYQVDLIREEETSPNVDFAGTWHGLFHSLLSGESVQVSSTPGDKVTFTFSGSVLGWMGYKGPLGGVAEVFVDGESHGIIDTWQTKHAFQKPVLILRDLAPGEHTLTIEVMQRPEGRSGQAWVWVDAFYTRPYAPSPGELQR